jgi:uncharacterized protein YacL
VATARSLDLTPASSAAPAPARLPAELFVEVVRLLIVGICTAVGHAIAAGAGGAPDAGDQGAFVGALLGACLGYVAGGIAGRILRRAMGGFEERVDQAPATSLLAGALGAAILGVVGGVVGIPAVVVLPGAWGLPVLGLTAWIGVYAGFQAGARKGEELLTLLRSTVGAAGTGTLRPLAADALEAGAHPLVLLDSSAAIDGRLAAVVGSGFLPGPLAVPRFVLDELQSIADAADPARRRRGHRALEMLETLRDGPGLGLMVLPDEVPEWEEVEAKLVALSHRLGAVLLTVDEPLAKAAELSGVRCLSLHRLAQSLQPVLVPGEVIRLTVSRHGRDEGQGVGFLDDGTMVVVSDGAEKLGRAVEVSIASSVQTSRGRMFFASLVS